MAKIATNFVEIKIPLAKNSRIVNFLTVLKIRGKTLIGLLTQITASFSLVLPYDCNSHGR
jgi:hypothetical protein